MLKALKKEPARCYSSAENFAEDIRRHQAGLPVTARPDTFSYRAGKFIRRNRLAALSGSLLLLAIIGGLVTTLWQTSVARAEAVKAQKINTFLQNVLNFSNPHWLSSNPKRNRDATIAQALDEALKTVETDLPDQPDVQAEIQFTIGKTYVSQGQYDKGEKLLRAAIDKFNKAYGTENVKSMRSSVILGDTMYLMA